MNIYVVFFLFCLFSNSFPPSDRFPKRPRHITQYRPSIPHYRDGLSSPRRFPHARARMIFDSFCSRGVRTRVHVCYSAHSRRFTPRTNISSFCFVLLNDTTRLRHDCRVYYKYDIYILLIIRSSYLVFTR